SAETYDVKLEHLSKVGDKYHLTATGSKNDQMRVFVDGKTNSQKTSIIADLRGAVEVLAVDTKGHETKLACKMERCLVRRAGVQTELFAKGKTVIIERRIGGKTFSVDNVAVSREESEALDILLEVHSADHDDDDIFGATDKKK